MKILASILTVAAIFFAALILSTVFGAVAGWVVGLFFGDAILEFLGRIGVITGGLAMWKIGASLGFIGGFFRSSCQK